MKKIHNSKYKTLTVLTYVLSYTFPLLTFAQSLNLPGSTFYDVLDYINIIISTLNPILFSLAFVVFFWGLSKFILNSDNKDEIEKGKKYMLWGVLVLFILISLRTIISLIIRDLGLGTPGTLIFTFPFLKKG